MNKKWFWFLVVVLGVVIFVGGPLFVQYTHWPQGTTGHGDWLGFWGSYLGIIPSGLIAFIVSKNETNKQYRNDLKKQIDFEDFQRILSINQELAKLVSQIEELSKNASYVKLPGIHPLIQPVYDYAGNYTNLEQVHVMRKHVDNLKQNIPMINKHDQIKSYIDQIDENFQKMVSTIATNDHHTLVEQLNLMRMNVLQLKNDIEIFLIDIKKA